MVLTPLSMLRGSLSEFNHQPASAASAMVKQRAKAENSLNENRKAAQYSAQLWYSWLQKIPTSSVNNHIANEVFLRLCLIISWACHCIFKSIAHAAVRIETI